MMHNPPDNVLDIITAQQDRAKVSRGYKFKTVAEMTAFPVNKNWLIKGVLARGESSAWIAAPGKMKSALMAEASICVAAGLDWHGFRNKGACGVVYFAIEREDLVRRRMLAHIARLGLSAPPIVVVGDLIDPKNAKKIIATIQEAGELLGVPIGLAVFDTFAKLIAAGGGDENSAKDQGAVFTCLQVVKNFTRAHVAIIGHTGKDESRGQRGSNAALGDCDLQVTITGEGTTRTANVTKNNDGPEGNLFSFCSEVHTFGTDEDGDPITVNVVSAEPVTEPAKTNTPKLSANQRVMFRLLHDAGPSGLTVEEWNELARALDIGVKRKAILWELREGLKDKGMVRDYNGRWTVAHD